MKDTGHVMAVVGAQTFIPGFEDQMIGQTVGEEFEVRVTFPDDYWSADLAGKEAVFICVVHEIGEIPVTDEGVEELSGGQFSTVDMLLDVIRSDMEEQRTQLNIELAFQTAFENATVLGIPQSERDVYMELLLEDLSNAVEQSGMSADELLQEQGFEDFDNYWDQVIEPLLNHELFMFAVAQAEGIEITDEDINGVLMMIRMQSGDMSMTDQDIFDNIASKGDIIRFIMPDKIETLIFENAVDANA
jgi:trigger factor